MTILHEILSYIADICQIRLDFDNFDITETTAGVCTDSFGISGPSGRNPLDLCGTLTGAHCEYLYQGDQIEVLIQKISNDIDSEYSWKRS